MSSVLFNVTSLDGDSASVQEEGGIENHIHELAADHLHHETTVADEKPTSWDRLRRRNDEGKPGRRRCGANIGRLTHSSLMARQNNSKKHRPAPMERMFSDAVKQLLSPGWLGSRYTATSFVSIVSSTKKSFQISI